MAHGTLPAYLAPNSQATYDEATQVLSVSGPTVFIGDPGSSAPFVVADGGTAVISFATGTVTQFHLASLTLTDGATAVESGTVAGIVEVAGVFSIDSVSTFDVGVGAIDLASADLAGVNALVASGYNLTGGGDWTGTGITSSAAAADTTHTTAVGAVSNADLGLTSFAGDPAVGVSDTLVKYTYFGDANLDGSVDGSDYSLIDGGAAAIGATGWYNGDFNDDGTVDGTDYALIDNAYNNQQERLPYVPKTENFPYFSNISAGMLDSRYVLTQTRLPVYAGPNFSPSLFQLGTSAEMRGAFQGSSASITIYSQGTNNAATGALVFDLTVDGVTTTPTVPANTELTLPLLTGGADAVHQWHITQVGGNSVGLYLGVDGVTVTGANPAVLAPAGFSGLTSVVPLPANIYAQPGHGTFGLNLFFASEDGSPPGGGIEFYSDATSIPVNVESGGDQIYALEYNAGGGWVVGQELTATDPTQFEWIDFAVPAGMKLDRILETGPGTGNWTIGSLGISPAPWVGPAPISVTYFGDSRFAGDEGIPGTTSIDSPSNIIDRATGFFGLTLARDGAALETGSGGDNLANQTNTYRTQFSAATDIAVLELGFNDVNYYNLIGGASAGTTASSVLSSIATSVANWIDVLIASNPAVEIVIASPTQGGYLPQADFDAVDGVVDTAASTAFNASTVRTSATLGFVNNYTAFSYGDMGGDHEHPTDSATAGQAISGDQVYGQTFAANAFLGTASSYVISVDTPLVVGQPATGTITFNGEPVCIAASNTSPSVPLTIMLNGTGFNAASSVITCTAPVVTFTFIPTAASGSLFATNSQMLANPADPAYFSAVG